VAVVSGGPADQAGIQRGDVITAVDGHQVASFADLLGDLRTTQPGQTIDVRVNRHGKSLTVKVKVGAR
jgi:S1-C subfamily serine protease